jgi:FixJ family two-component response regulator
VRFLSRIDQLQVHDTSCLITDVQMPGLNGIDLQDRLIARGHRIPIIFMTGYRDDSVRARAMKAGAVCFLNKPLREDHYIAQARQRAGAIIDSILATNKKENRTRAPLNLNELIAHRLFNSQVFYELLLYPFAQHSIAHPSLNCRYCVGH